MPVYLGAKKQTLYLGAGDEKGMSNVRLYLGDKLVYIPFRPPEGDLLLAGQGVYLKGGADVYLDYKNMPLVLQDSLSGKIIGTGPFDISFEFTPQAGCTGTRFLFEVPGLAKFGYCEGQGLLVYLQGTGWRSVGTQPSGGPVHEGSNTVHLWRSAAGADIRLDANGTQYILFDAFQLLPWQQPVLTSNTSYGVVSSSANRSTTATQAEWHACDGLLPDADDQYTYFGLSGCPGWWQWKLPVKLRISGLALYNRASTGTTNYTKNIQFFTSAERSTAITQSFLMPANSTELVTAPMAADYTDTDTIYAYISDDYGGGYPGIGELYVTAQEFKEPEPPAFEAGTLIIYAREVKNLLLKDSYGG